MDTVTLGFYVLGGLLCLVCLPFAIWCSIRLYKDWNELYIIKRHRILVLVGLVDLITLEFTWVSWTIYSGMTDDLVKELGIFEQIILYPGIYMYVIVTSIRLWFLWYDINISKLQLQRAWRMAINPNSESEDWFIKNESTWGNEPLLLGYGSIFAISFSLITVLLYINNQDIAKWLVALFCLLIEMVYVLVMWLKMRTFYYDNLGIKKEFLYFWIVVFVFILIGLIGTVTMESFEITNNDITRTLFWSYFMLFFFNALLFGLIPLPKWLILRKKQKETRRKQIFLDKKRSNPQYRLDGPTPTATATMTTTHKGGQTPNSPLKTARNGRISSLLDLLPLHNSKHNNGNNIGNNSNNGNDAGGAKYSKYDTSDPIAIVRNNSNNGNTGHNGTGTDVNVNVFDAEHERYKIEGNWSNIIVTQYGYESFMSHLEREFSIENFLFITEYIQIKNVLKREFHEICDKMMKEHRNTRYDLQLPSNHLNNGNNEMNNNNNNNNNDRTRGESYASLSDGNSNPRTPRAARKRRIENEKGIPQSLIARKLMQYIRNLYQCSNEENGPTANNLARQNSENNKKKRSSIRSLSGSAIHAAVNAVTAMTTMSTVANSNKAESPKSNNVQNDSSKYVEPTASSLEAIALKIEVNAPVLSENDSKGTVGSQSVQSDQSVVTPHGASAIEENRIDKIAIETGENGSHGTEEIEDSGLIRSRLRKKVDMTSISIGLCIIQSFDLIYNKYISESAKFMINISSSSRNKLKKLFDSKYYKRIKSRNLAVSGMNDSRNNSVDTSKDSAESINGSENNGNNKSKTGFSSISVGKDKLAIETNDFSNLEITVMDAYKQISNFNEDSSVKNRTMMIDEFLTFSRMRKDDLTEYELLEWLLIKLITTMELAIYEISKLMNDSFVRFKTSDVAFDKSVNLALQQLMQQK